METAGQYAKYVQLTVETLERRPLAVLIVNFDYIESLTVLCILLTLNN